MTHTGRNMSGNGRTSGDVRAYAASVFLMLVLLGLPAEIRAADERTGPSFSASIRTANDIETEARILRTLRKDAQLGPLNLGVHVAGGTAKLTGPVPTAELKKRAITIAKNVEGVLAVQSRDLYVSSSDQGRKRMSVLIQDDPAAQTRAASPPLPSNDGGRPSRNEITLLAPEIAAPPPRVGEAARLTANPRSVSPAVSLASAVEQLRQREARYQQIRARVQGTTVFVLPGDAADENAMMFAQAVRRLPGVEHVIISSRSR
jgi:osmotically-inducible protein OsmY